MRSLIFAAIDRSRTTLLLLLFLVVGGYAAYMAIPKEANPDITIPMIYVSMSLEGVSPEDAERLLVRPMEQELRSLEGVKEMRGNASEGHASVMLEFDAGFDADKALQDVREQVDTARSNLPQEADEPRVNEVNISLFPVMSIGLSGPLAERELITIARGLKDAIEAMPEVLEVDIAGDREDLLEIVVAPQVLESYGLDFNQLGTLVSRNNQLVAAGTIDTGNGRMTLKVPGVIENVEDVMSIPVKVDGDTVITFGDVAMLQRSYKDPQGFARINGEPAARFGTDVASIGNAVRLVTNGLVLANYRPEDVRDEVDIVVRVPSNWRELEQLERQTMNTPRGQVPLSQFVSLEPGDKTGNIVRVDGRRTITIKADLQPGRQVEEALRELRANMLELPDGITVLEGGESEDQQQAANFLMNAFMVAIGLMLLILVTQFNSLYQSFLILSAIVLSTAGVLLGLLLNSQPFGIVMVGMGTIALAGIVVNNNIILIDTYNQMRADGMEPATAALETGCLRLRPVLLTAIPPCWA